MDYVDYWINVVELAKSYGYSDGEISCFAQDIEGCYDSGYTVEECVEEVF